MPSIDDKSLDGEDPLEPPSSLLPQMHLYPFPQGLLPPQQPMRSKRRQVKNACTNCQKACKKCDDARPCLRCVKYGISEECIDSQRKERKKGIKRGPYKKRDGKGSNVEPSGVAPQGLAVLNGVPTQPTGSPATGTYLSIGYPPAFFPQYQSIVSKVGDPAPPPPTHPVYTSPYFLAPLPHALQPQVHPTQDGNQSFGPPQGYYSGAVFAPIPYHHPQYTIPRSDGQGQLNTAYPLYPANATYAKQHTIMSHNQLLNSGLERHHQDQNGVVGKAS